METSQGDDHEGTRFRITKTNCQREKGIVLRVLRGESIGEVARDERLKAATAQIGCLGQENVTEGQIRVQQS